MKTIYIILISLFFLASCKKANEPTADSGLFLSSGNSSAYQVNRAFELGGGVNILGKWNFLYYSDKKAHKYETSLEFKDERASGGTLNLSGKLVMNFYTATFKLENDKITIENIGTTKVGVTGDAAAFEQKFVESLKNATRLQALDKNTLLIYLSQPKDEVLYFGR